MPTSQSHGSLTAELWDSKVAAPAVLNDISKKRKYATGTCAVGKDRSTKISFIS